MRKTTTPFPSSLESTQMESGTDSTHISDYAQNIPKSKLTVLSIIKIFVVVSAIEDLDPS
jgi:hypothetical protein